AYTILDSADTPVTDSIIPAGAYKIVASGLSIIAPANYITEYITGRLIVNPAPLNVIANDKVIYGGYVLPAFTSTINGFIGNDSTTIISGPDYTLDPAYSGAPGIYTIIPSGLVLSKQGNYSIAYIFGTLYVNPDKNTSKEIKPILDCMETVQDNSSEFKYIAHFSYKNNNKTSVYIPIGKDNNLYSSGTYSGVQPELFLPGTGYFNIYFDGAGLTWTVKSYQCNKKVSEKAYACSTSQRCNNTIASQTGNSSALEEPVTKSNEGSIKIYPNPVTDRVTIFVDNTIISEKDVYVYDMMGRLYTAKKNLNNLTHHIELNLSQLNKGMYIIKIRLDNGFKSFMIMKK
ncbi:MAG: T9SS type A sorting domain-containing protein, partial [Panacibacter sp.]